MLVKYLPFYLLRQKTRPKYLPLLPLQLLVVHMCIFLIYGRLYAGLLTLSYLLQRLYLAPQTARPTVGSILGYCESSWSCGWLSCAADVSNLQFRDLLVAGWCSAQLVFLLQPRWILQRGLPLWCGDCWGWWGFLGGWRRSFRSVELLVYGNYWWTTCTHIRGGHRVELTGWVKSTVDGMHRS